MDSGSGISLMFVTNAKPEEPVVVAELEAQRAGDVAGVVLPAVVRVFVEAGADLGAVGLLGRGRGKQRYFGYPFWRS